MRMEKINEHQVRCLISNQDLLARHLTAGELRYGAPEVRALFSEVLQTASRQYGFNKEEYPVMIEAVPVNEGLLIVLSAVENPEETDPHFAHFHEEEEESPIEGDTLFQMPADQMPDIRHTVFRFTGIDDAVAFSRRAGGFEGESRLYRGDEPHEFFMILMRPEGMEASDFITRMNQLVEYSDGIPGDPIFAAKLLEHDKPVLTDAVNILRRM